MKGRRGISAYVSTAPKPVEVKVVSMPPASAPAEVKVVALPAAAAPTAVRVVAEPEDESGKQLVKSTDRLALATWMLAVLTGGVFVYTAVLARTTSRVARSQSDELARRDKDGLAREVHRAAHRLRLDAERARLLASARVNRRVTVGAMMGGGGAAQREVLEKARDKELDQLNAISATTDYIAAPGVDAFDVLGKFSAADLAKRQWALDRDQALVDVMSDASEKEIARIEAERVRYLNEASRYRAAKMGQPDPHT